MNKQTKAFSSDISVVDGERAVSAVISTTAVDRDGEALIPQGCNWKDFQLNPVSFLSHNYADWFGVDVTVDKLPIGQCTALTRDKDSISFKMTFAERPATYPAGKEWIPDTLFSLYQQRVMRAFSVGFVPIETRAATDKDLLTYGAECRRVISKWKLLEVSCVALPANQEAVALAVSKGLITQERGDKLAATMATKATADHLTAGLAPRAAEAEGDGAGATKTKDSGETPKPQMATCSKCDKQFPMDDMEEVDGAMYCADCMPQKSAAAAAAADDVTAAVEAAIDAEEQKHVVRAIEQPPEAEPNALKHVVREIEDTGAGDQETEVKHVHRVILDDSSEREERNIKLVHRHLGRLRGRIYAD